MKKNNCPYVALGIVMGVVAVAVAVAAFVLLKKKKKREDEELEYYLDYSIQ